VAEQTYFTRKRVKCASAIVGGSTVVAMGALTVALGGNPDVSPSFVSGGMQRGSTVTQVAPTMSTPDSVLATTRAVPAIKGPATLPSEELGPATPGGN
jgi:hypothetical protein